MSEQPVAERAEGSGVKQLKQNYVCRRSQSVNADSAFQPSGESGLTWAGPWPPQSVAGCSCPAGRVPTGPETPGGPASGPGLSGSSWSS